MEPLSVADLAGDLPRPGVLCTLAEVTGSAPQSPGAKMWVWADGFQGTLGGGKFEASVLADARRMLSEGEDGAALKEYVLCRANGQCCGGKTKVLFEVCPRRKAVHIFGAGHVSRSLSSVLDGLDLEVVVYDARPEWSDKTAFPASAHVLRVDPLAIAASAKFSATDAVVIMTHDHDLDLALVDAVLDRPVGFIGVIGSEHKARVFRSRLPAPRRALWDERVQCPIGRKIASKRPKAIAVGVAASLLDWSCRKAPAVLAESR
ncbi:MAG: xanthine dehydrogenase accessory protein XdhC [Elusimicrobia bacterium]|nr:xanthine dehydrogenase accessory protein XdhC [Elusimicrobiota bacterium]